MKPQYAKFWLIYALLILSIIIAMIMMADDTESQPPACSEATCQGQG